MAYYFKIYYLKKNLIFENLEIIVDRHFGNMMRILSNLA